MFSGYKLKFELNAAHSNIEVRSENMHFHTFTIVLYLDRMEEGTDYFNAIEENINQWLNPFQNQYLSDTYLFMDKSTTIESIGDSFFDELSPLINKRGLDLVRLDIYENPIRTYSVSDRMLDGDINQIGALPYAFFDTVTSTVKTCTDNEFAAATKEDVTQITDEKVDEIIEEKHSKDLVEKSDGYNKPHRYNKSQRVIGLIVGIIVIAFVAVAIMYSISICGNYPTGSDTYCHLYRGDVILQSIENGIWYPLYDSNWYNGVELMRYWGPVPLYTLALLEYLGGSMFFGYIGYVGLVFFIGALGFTIFGYKMKRLPMGVFIGIMWFFLPENMKVLFYDGNLPRAIINALLPFLLILIFSIIKEQKNINIILLSLLCAFISLCHIGTTIMLLVVVTIYLLIYGKVNKTYRPLIWVLICAVVGILMSGIWMVASLHGSGAGGSSNQVMIGFFQNIFKSLNPAYGWRGETIFYFGISIFIICVLGLFLGNKKTLPGFAVGLIIFFLTSNSAYGILKNMPFSSYLWMMRFVSLSLVFIMASLVMWKGLKKPVVIAILIMLVLDCIPSIRFIYSEDKALVSVEEQNDSRADDLLINKGKEITNQRMAIFDLSGYGAFAPYYVAGVPEKTSYVFGAGWEGARTASNIVMLNGAVESGRYNYVFDRSIELGADTLVFVVNNLKNKQNDIKTLVSVGQNYGYEMIGENNSNILFHKDTPKNYGVLTNYSYIAIGKAAKDIAMVYPAFKEGDWDNINEYSFGDLKKYEIIYLSDFTYDDIGETEAILDELGKIGVKVYIDMNKIPVNPDTNVAEIFGVSVQTITFNKAFPTIMYKGEKYKTSGFPKDNEEWKANYLIGLDEALGYGDINGETIDFIGTQTNENITFLGYNFVYYVELTNDIMGEKLLSDILGVEVGQSPDRQIVPLDISVDNNLITIDSNYDNVNTTLSYISDIFYCEDEYSSENNLVVVDKGRTVIRIKYPYMVQGIIVSVIGFILLIGLLIFNKYTRLHKV